MTLSSFIWLHGFQTGIWVNAFGHGSALSHETSQAVQPSFTQMTGVYGESFGYADCPLDPHFTSALIIWKLFTNGSGKGFPEKSWSI